MSGNMVFAQRIKALRNAHNESQAALAKEFNYRKQSVSHWENNGKVPRTGVLRFLAKRYGVSMDYLLGNDAEAECLEGVVQTIFIGEKVAGLSDQEVIVLDIFRRMDRKEKEVLLKMLDVFTRHKICFPKAMSLATDHDDQKIAETSEEYKAGQENQED